VQNILIVLTLESKLHAIFSGVNYKTWMTNSKHYFAFC